MAKPRPAIPRHAPRVLRAAALTVCLSAIPVPAALAGEPAASASTSSEATATAAATPAATPEPPSPAMSPTATAAPPRSDAERSLWAAEEGFAASFAARDAERFASYLDEQVVFAGGKRTLHGKREVREVWTRMMTSGPQAPFRWQPTRAIVSGDVGMTSGPVFDPAGIWVGAFTSVWRRQPGGSWHIVLDGAPPCEAPPPEPPPAH